MVYKRLLFCFAAALLVAGMSFARGSTESTAGSSTTAAASQENGPLTPMAQPVTLTAVLGFDPPIDSDALKGATPETNTFLKILKEKLNIQIRWLWTVPSDQYSQKLKLSLSSGQIPDIMQIVSAADFANLASANQLADMSDAYTKYALDTIKGIMKHFNNDPLKFATINGKLLSIPNVLDNTNSVGLLYVRQDWLDKLGLPEPKTIDDVERIAVSFARDDPDRNGQADTTGLGLQKTLYGSGFFDASGFFQGFGAYPNAWLLKGGNLVPGTIQPEVKEALLKLREIYSKGGINTEFAVKSQDQLVQDIVASKVGMIYGQWWNPAWPLNLNLENDHTARWKAFNIVSAKGSPAKTIIPRNVIQSYNVVSSSAPKDAPEAAMKLMNLWMDIAQNPNAESVYGNTKPSEGYIWNWVPIYVFNDAITGTEYYNLVHQALAKNDPSILQPKSVSNWDYPVPQYNATINWLKDGMNAPDGATNWGIWYSRVAQDGGRGLSIKAMNEKLFIYNEYYGLPTPTETERSSTLQDMTNEYFDKFVMGSVPADSWDKLVSDWKALGGDAWTKEANLQYAQLPK